MKSFLSFFGLFMILALPSTSMALEGCPSDPQGLLDFVSHHVELQRQASFKSQVIYHDLGNNVSLTYERTASAGNVSLRRLSPSDIKATMAMSEIIKKDSEGTPSDRELRELTESNYKFTFEGQDSGLYKYSLIPLSPLKGRLKSGEIWLDPKTCDIRTVDGVVLTQSHIVPRLKIHADYVTVKGVYLSAKTLFTYKPILGIKSGQTEVIATFNPDEVMPPAALAGDTGAQMSVSTTEPTQKSRAR